MRQIQEVAVNDMHARARETALEMHVCDEAKSSLRRQLLELAKKNGQEWEITFRDEHPFVVEQADRKL